MAEFVKKSLEEFNAKDAAIEVEKFVSDLSTWYIRGSRDRVWVNSEDRDDKKSFYSTLYFIFSNLPIILSPFMPFISEEIYSNLSQKESVHLETWPTIKRELIDDGLMKEMELIRKVVEAGHAKRKADGVKVRIPLLALEVEAEGDYKGISPDVWEVALKELNIKNLLVNKDIRYPVKSVEVAKEDLEKEGQLRELIRTIQSKRKELGLKPTDKINLTVPDAFMENLEFIQKRVMARKIEVGRELIVKS